MSKFFLNRRKDSGQGVIKRIFVSLRTKFVFFISFIIVAVCSGLSFYVVKQQVEFMVETLKNTGLMMVNNLAHNSRYSLITHDQPSLERVVDGTMKVREVVYVVMTDSEGKILLFKSKSRPAEAMQQPSGNDADFLPDISITRALLKPESQGPIITRSFLKGKRDEKENPLRETWPRKWAITISDESVFDFAVPVRRRSSGKNALGPLSLEAQEITSGSEDQSLGSVYGIVQVGLTNVHMLESLNTVILNIVLITLLIIIAGISATVFLANRIITPLQSLAGVARRVAAGDLNASVMPTTSDEVGQLTTIFNQMTQSLQDRERAISVQMETITRQVNQLTTLNQTGMVITSNLDLNRLLSTVLQLLVEKVGFAHMILMQYDPETRMAFGAQTAGISETLVREAQAMEIPIENHHSLHGEILTQGHALFVVDRDQIAHRTHPDFLVLLQKLGVTSFVCAPIKSQQGIHGFIEADKMPEPCTQEDLDLLVTIGNTIGVAIANARAYQQLAQFAVTLEERVEERTLELREANLKLRELDQLKSVFVSIVSHELRTPMTSIKGLVENMLDGLTGELSERQSFYLSRVRINIERLTRMINDLLDLSKIEAGAMKLQAIPVNVVDVVGEVIEAFQQTAQAKSITLEAQQVLDIPPVHGDRDKISQIFTNLIHNAIKFTDPGGFIRVEFERPENDVLQICVSNTGCGIPPHELQLIFDRFFRSQASSPEIQGAGLGLAITKTLVELHGGQIWVESKVEQGTRFYFTLPLQQNVT